MLKKTALGLFCLALLLGLAALPAFGYVEKGNKLGDLQFAAPITPEDAKYLGVPADKPFKLDQVGAPFLLVEIFATGCSHCYAHAPHMNELFDMINKDPQTAGKVKMMGLAQNDSPDNVASWKKQLKVPFALVPDSDGKVSEKINIMGTPTTILLNKKGDVLYAKPGATPDMQAVLKDIKDAMK
jgi:thiol-disulfide isomerase/thioredoxin